MNQNHDSNITSRRNTFAGLAKELKIFYQYLCVLACIIFYSAIITTNSPALAATLITNTATANYSIGGIPNQVSHSVQFSKDTVVTPTDTITLSKQVNASSVEIGELIIYTLTIQNPNATALNNLVIDDIVPAGLTYATGTAKLNGITIPNPSILYAGNLLKLTLGNIPASSTWIVSYQLEAVTEGVKLNKATARTDTATSQIAQASTLVTKPADLPLILSKQANKQIASLGDIIEYQLNIKNPNSKEVLSGVLNDDLPAGQSYIVNSASLNNIPITANAGNGLAFNLGTIPANAQWTLNYKAKLVSRDGSNISVNSANIITADTVTDSNTATASVKIRDDIILINKSVNTKKVLVGNSAIYTITVTNPESHTQSNIVITDTLPAGFNYVAGTASIPATQLSNNQLSFSIDTIEKNKTLTITYEVLVTKNAAIGESINTAQAKGDFTESEIASASVKVRTPSTIKFLKIDDKGIEAIIPPTSYNDNQNGGKHWQEVTTVTLADGSVISLPTPQLIIDAEEYTPLDPIVIEVVDLDQNTDPTTIQTIIVVIEVPGSSDKEVLLLQETGPNTGIFVGVIAATSDKAKVQNGVLSLKEGSHINVTYRDEEDLTDTSATAALVIPNTPIALSKTADKTSASIGEQVRYTLTFNNASNYTIPELNLNDLLPLGFRYIPKTARLNGELLTTGVITNGRTINFKLGRMPIGKSWTIEYLTKITAGVQIGKSVNVAVIDSGKFTSNQAKASVMIKDDLMQSKNILSGRVYIGCTTGKDAKVLKDTRIFMETGRSVLSDDEGFWHMEGVRAGKHVLQIDEISLPTGYKPILCQNNTRHAGNARSQFVDLQAGTLWHVEFHVQKQTGFTGDKQDKATLKKSGTEEINPLELYGKKYLKTAPEGFEILWPKNNYVPSVASTNILVKSSPQHKVEVFLNGGKISPLNYDGSNTNINRTITIRRWKGVDLNIKNINNTLLVILKDKSGKEIARKVHNIHFSGEATSADFLPEESTLVADGKTTPIIALFPKDKDGFRLRTGTHGYFSLDSNQFQVKKSLTKAKESLNQNESTSGTYKYIVEEDGIARISLNPTTQSGEISLKIKFPDSKNKIIKAWIKPKLREWILVGLMEGTLAHNTLIGNMKSLEALDKADSFAKHGRVAFYAQGKVKGKYLLTVAYDTHKEKQEVGSQLNGKIDPDAWYTIYGDNSNSQYNAPSSRKLYLKIEKDNFYALFGDFNTTMNITELAKYERVLNGIKSEYKGRNYSYTAFISETHNKYHHKEIPGDGTSGLYYLTSNIAVNSETIKLEIRDRFHSERILESRVLTQYRDYDIDYAAGTLFFKFPITGRDDNFNPQFIIADYDSDEDSNKETVMGGRIAIKTDNTKLEAGLSTIIVNRDNAKNDSLIALDANYKLNKDTKLHIEVAQSKTAASNFKSTQAEIIELEKEIADMEARLYYRKQGKNFGIVKQASENGTKKIGAELKYKINDKISINTEVSQQSNLSNNNKRQLAEVNIKHQHKQFELSAGLRHSKETIESDTLSNNTLLLGGRYTTKSGKLSFRTNIEENLNSSNTGERSPNRKIVGVDLNLTKNTTAFAEYEITDSNKVKTQNSRIGLTQSLWKGAKAKTSYTKEVSNEGVRDYANVGLNQRIQLTKKLHADITIDHAKTLNNTQKHVNDNEPAIQGAQQDDYTAFSVGLGSQFKNWDWTSRIELRKGDVTDKVNFRFGLIHKIKNGKQVSASFDYTNSENSNGEYDKKSKISLGSAWHPKEKNFVFFNRLDFIDEKENKVGATSINSHTQKVVHNMHYNQKITDKTQISVHHGIKHIIDRNKQEEHKTTIDTGTVEIRHDINKKWDIGARIGYLHDWKSNTTEKVAGVSIGMTPTKNAWVEVGYNFEGFSDEDFDNNNYKQKGAYIGFKYKFDQDSFKGKDLPIR